MPTIEEALRNVRGVEDGEVISILQYLEDERIGFTRGQEAAGPFLRLDADRDLPNLSLRLRLIVKDAQGE